MRFIIYGAGAIGGVVGGRLHLAGEEVVLIARGAHLAAIREHGLRVRSADSDVVVRAPVVSSPAEISFSSDDIVLLCMKTQDTTEALAALRAAAGDTVAVACLQNGVTNERMALRRFSRVYGTLVMLPATHLEPGVVQADSSPTPGMLDTGIYPGGVDVLATALTEAFVRAGFSALALPDVMRWKYAKLLSNLNNALQALCADSTASDGILAQLKAEAEACYRAAGIAWASDAEYYERRANFVTLRPVAGGARAGSSTWQSVRRGTGSVEADYLNGEICLLGRLHGVPTPANAVVQRESNRVAAAGIEPGSLAPSDVAALIEKEASGVTRGAG